MRPPEAVVIAVAIGIETGSDTEPVLAMHAVSQLGEATE